MAMINKLTLHNFKSIGEQTYEFTQFDLLVGRNNSGKSTVLQALAIWQFCIDEFRRSKRAGNKGIQIVLPNFTALPVPEFNLLWKNKTDRHWPIVDGAKKQEYILIGIDVEWKRTTGELDSFGVQLRYHSPQTMYAIPSDGWKKFRDLDQRGDLPVVAYVPPFSGLEPAEKWLDISPLRQQVGKGQPGSVLRNLLLRVSRGEEGRAAEGVMTSSDWRELAQLIERWFSVRIHEPKYDSAKDVNISVEYRQNGKDYDIIAQGSGFHQTLTLLAFLYGYHPTTILLDEPDAHLHVNLQREILDFFKRKSLERNIQFLIATHAEEFVRGVDSSQIVSLLHQVPERIKSTPDVLRAMSDVSNEEITRLVTSPFILYVEGESDERILRAWAPICGAQDAIGKVSFRTMRGGSKEDMKKLADNHFAALRQVIPSVKRLMIFDFDSAEKAFHPDPSNPSLAEWKRKNIENYLLVPDAWKRAAGNQLQVGGLFALPVSDAIDKFFAAENLTLPPGQDWQNVAASVFSVVDGKRMLFEYDNSLFHQLRNAEPSVQLLREQVAATMNPGEIHQDVHDLFERLKQLTNTGKVESHK
jgi:predicted ATPase